MGGWTTTRVVGRRAEKASIARFLKALPSGPLAMVVEGEAGVGKTSLWEWGLHGAEDRSYTALATAAAPSDAKLSYAGIDDLLEPVLDDSLPALPAPRRHALEVALLRRSPRGPPPNRWAVARAVLDVLRVLAARSPLVLGIDDVQWLDRSSSSALSFALRRLRDEPIGALVSVRVSADEAPGLDLARAFSSNRMMQLALGPMERGDLQRIVRSELGVILPQQLLARVHETSGGNPFFALELARELLRHGMDEVARDRHLSIPITIREAVAARLAPLSQPSRRLLLHAAMLAQPTIGVLHAVGGARSERAIVEAADAGIVELDADRVRFTHPLLASVLFSDADVAVRRRVHRRLAGVVSDPEERARHLAFAAAGPDAEAARMLDEAARHAASRGAPDAAASLYEHARRLTPTRQRREAFRRGVGAIDYHFVAGELRVAEHLASEMLASVQDDVERATLLYRLGLIGAREGSWPEAERRFLSAVPLSGGDPTLHSELERELALTAVVRGDIEKSIDHARRGLDLAEAADDPSVLAQAMGAVLTFEFIGGRGLRDDLLARLTGFTDVPIPDSRPKVGYYDFRLGQALVLAWADDLGTSRSLLLEGYERALHVGDEVGLPSVLYHLAELECWAGRWDDAERYASEALALVRDGENEMVVPVALYAVALLYACRGDVEAARSAAIEGQERAVRTGNAPISLMIAAVQGFLELSLGHPAAAHQHLWPVTEAMLGMGATEPGVVHYMADEIEALVGLGRLDQAQGLTDHLETRGRELDRPWALVTGARCRALLRAAEGDLPGATAAIEESLRLLPRLPMPLEEGRTWLAAGIIARRAKRKGQAKDALNRALGIFDNLGASLWSAKAQAELARVGLRPSTSLELTPTEARVAELVSAGHTNREVASKLFISPKTVEANLSRIYRKLGVRSRTELAGRLAGPGALRRSPEQSRR